MPDMFKEPAAVVLGFDWNEAHQVSDFQIQHPNWTVEAPMMNAPIWDKCRMLQECDKLGFKVPMLYHLGFSHNNCGGFCVKAGISHFVHLYHKLPAEFEKNLQEELLTAAEFKRRGIQQYSVLKDRRGGEVKPLFLFALKQRIQAGEKFTNIEWGGCGCGGATKS